MRRALAVMGRTVIEPLADLGGVAQLFLACLVRLPRRSFEWRLFLREMESIGVRSALVVGVLGVFTGMVLIVQIGDTLKRLGAELYASEGTALAILRELGPVLAAFLIAGRVGSGIAAEIGAMKIGEQIDAMRSMGADPVRKLVLPKVVAAFVSLPLLTVLANVLGIVGGMVMGVLILRISPYHYMHRISAKLEVSDFTHGVLKTAVFGVLIVLVSSHFGFKTTGGTTGVGESATKSVVMSCILILCADLLINSAIFALGGVLGV